MLRLLIYLVLFAAEQETTETHKRTFSIVGVRVKLEELLKDTEHFARDDLAFFDLKTFDTTILKMLENAELQVNDGALTISKFSSLRRQAEWHPFLYFMLQHATGIKFDPEAIAGKFWKA